LIRPYLTKLTHKAISQLVSTGTWPQEALRIPVEVDIPKTAGHADFMTNFALIASKKLGQNPRAIAEALAETLKEQTQIFQEVEVAGPGFVNFQLRPGAVAEFGREVLQKGAAFCHLTPDIRRKINIEFVSVNPNGPITIGSGRGAAFGSTLANVLEAAGHEVHREYYINDGVNSTQMRLFSDSVKALALGEPIPEKGYQGDYVQAVAHDLPDQIQRLAELDDLTERPYLATFARASSKAEVAMLAKVTTLLASIKAKWQNDLPSFLARATEEEMLFIVTDAMVAKQQSDLSAFGVHFDTWFSEQSLHEAGMVASDIESLVTKGVADSKAFRTKLQMAKGGEIKAVTKEAQVVDEDDAEGEGVTLWLRSTKFGDDMDRVLRRKDGRLTYIASDVTYHKDKLKRPEGADQLLTVLGPDHHGYISRLHSVLAAVEMIPGVTPDGEMSEFEQEIYSSPQDWADCRAAKALSEERLKVLIFQIVRFLKDGKPAPMRKRDGNIYALIDLLHEIGIKMKPSGSLAEQEESGGDVARFFYLMRHHDTAMDFDLDLAARQGDENPVFYAQYGHARICSVIDRAESLGLSLAPEVDWSCLTHDKEKALMTKICDLPYEVERCAADFAVNRLTTYVIELARLYHSFYDSCRVIQPEEQTLSKARLALCHATRIAFRSAFRLLGISAPERMERPETQES
jgi:arginyl-tRNA synthetase